MKHYYCLYCEDIFSEEDAKHLWTSDGHGIEEVLACPTCRSDEIVEAGTCKCCGKPIRPDAEYCDVCSDALYKIWDSAVCKVIDIAAMGKDYLECKELFLDYLEDAGVI